MGLPYPGLVKKIMCDFGIYKSEVESVVSVTTDLSLFDNIHWKFEEEKGWVNTRLETPPPKPVTPLEVEPLNVLPAKPAEGTSDMLVLIRGMMENMEVLTEKVAKVEEMGEKILSGKEFDWANDLGAKAAIIETMPTLLKEVEDSVNINLTHCTQIKEELIELNRNLRFVATEVVGQLKKLLNG